jgi:hypothetical protein
MGSFKPILATLILCASAAKADAGDKWTVYGWGTQSCGAWIAAAATDPVARLEATEWILGWVSATGLYSAPLKESDVVAMNTWVDGYCQAHPLDDVQDAAAYLTGALAKKHKQLGR